MNIIAGPARSRVLTYVSSVLRYENFLCKCVASSIDFTCGVFRSIDPAARPFEDIENFRWGGMHGIDEDIGRRLFSSLTAKSYRILVIDDVMGDISSKYNRSAVHEGQLYHWIHGEGTTEEEIDELVWMTALPWHSLAVIFSSEPDIYAGRCITEGRCSDLGEIIEVIFGAYDGEGFIHWTPD